MRFSASHFVFLLPWHRLRSPPNTRVWCVSVSTYVSGSAEQRAASEVTTVYIIHIMYRIRDRKCIFTFIGSNFYCCPAIKLPLYWYCFHIAAARRCCMKTPPFKRVNVLCHHSSRFHLCYAYLATASGNCLGHLFICILSPRFSSLFWWRFLSGYSLLLRYCRCIVGYCCLPSLPAATHCGCLYLPSSIEWRTSQNTLNSIDDNFYLHCCCCRCCFQMIGIISSVRQFSRKYKCTPRYLPYARCMVYTHSERANEMHVLCLIEFSLDLNTTEQGMRWNMNRKRDKRRSVLGAVRLIHIFL